MKYNTSILFFFLITFACSQVGVGIGTNNPQAQLDVDGGSVRFSDYGVGTYQGLPLFFLGVDTYGDVIEIQNTSSVPGLQYHMWDIPNTSQPNIESVRALGVASSSGAWTSNLDNNAMNTIASSSLDGFIIRFSGTLAVQNTGNFTFNARSDDGSRIYIDDVLVVENWFNQPPTTRSGSINLTAGEHRIEFWFYDNEFVQTMEFTWGSNPDGYTVGSFINASQLLVK